MMVLTIVGFASYFSYRQGMLYGGKITLQALEAEGIITIEREDKTVKKM